jgi:hypothetical protein
MFHGLQIASHPTVSVSFVQKMFFDQWISRFVAQSGGGFFSVSWQVANA